MARLCRSTSRDRRKAASETALRRTYDGTLEAFSLRNGMGAVDWSKRAINRLGTIKALSGRDRMRAATRCTRLSASG